MSEQPESCQCCYYETLELKAYPRYGPENKTTLYWFCELCAGSSASNAIGYPAAYPDGAAFLAGVVMNAANHILAELRVRRGEAKGGV